MKFKVGDIVYMVQCKCGSWPRARWGRDSEVLELGPGLEAQEVDTHVQWLSDYYIKDLESGKEWAPDECCLRKRRPPEQPAEKEFQADLKKWLKPKVAA